MHYSGKTGLLYFLGRTKRSKECILPTIYAEINVDRRDRPEEAGEFMNVDQREERFEVYEHASQA